MNRHLPDALYRMLQGVRAACVLLFNIHGDDPVVLHAGILRHLHGNTLVEPVHGDSVARQVSAFVHSSGTLYLKDVSERSSGMLKVEKV